RTTRLRPDPAGGRTSATGRAPGPALLDDDLEVGAGDPERLVLDVRGTAAAGSARRLEGRERVREDLGQEALAAALHVDRIGGGEENAVPDVGREVGELLRRDDEDAIARRPALQSARRGVDAERHAQVGAGREDVVARVLLRIEQRDAAILAHTED